MHSAYAAIYCYTQTGQASGSHKERLQTSGLLHNPSLEGLLLGLHGITGIPVYRGI